MTRSLRGLRVRAVRPTRWSVEPAAVALAVLAVTLMAFPGTALLHAPTRTISARTAGERSEMPLLATSWTPAATAVYLANHTVGWSQVASPPPGFGVNGGLAADTATDTAFAFGGTAATGLVNTTLAYNESTNLWTNISGSVAPSPRSDFALGFDANLGVGALFGGVTNLTTLVASNETWKIGTTGAWTREATGTAPPAREAGAFAVDPSLGVGLLYGGWNQSYSPTAAITYSDLWELNLSTWSWTQVAVSGVRPPPLEGASLTWDPNIAKFLLYGGCYPCSSTVWEFDPGATTWTALPVAPASPMARGAAVWAYDPSLGAELLFGGTGGVGAFNSTFLFYPSNNTWVPQTLLPDPGGRYDAASGFLDVPGNETLLVAGGRSGTASFDDLWRLSTTSDLSLQVVNASNLSSPLDGVRVNLSGREAGETNVSGTLTLSQVNLVAQPLNLTDDPWYYPLNRTLWESPGEPASLDLALTPEPLGNVNVSVDAATGGPVFNASTNLTIDGVRINSVPQLTDNLGNTSFHGVPPGRLNLTASMPDWRPTYLHSTMPPGANLSEQLVLTTDPVLGVLVLGQLADGARVPLSGASVVLDDAKVGSTTSAGEFIAPTDDYGLSTVVVYAFGFVTAGTYVNIPWTGPVSTTLLLSSQPYATLAVTVESNTTYLPISGATVTASTAVALAFGDYDLSGATDPTGLASLSLPEGTYTLSASATGFFSASPGTLYSLGPAENATALVFLDPIPPATVHFRVLDNSTHRPIRNASVSYDLSTSTDLTDIHGFCNLTGLLPGNYVFQFTAPGYIPNMTVMTLASNENISVEVNLTLIPSVTVPGYAGWAFALFPGGLDELWPFLAAPAFLVLGAFVYSSVRRAGVFTDDDPLGRRRPPGATTAKPPVGSTSDRPPPSPPGPPA